MDPVTIEPAREEDLAAMLTLVAASGLALDGLRELVDTSLVARLGDRVVGTAAVEI